jgi:hypothetical protein
MGSGNNFLDIVFILLMFASFLLGVGYLAWAIKGTLDGSSWTKVFERYIFSIVFILLSSSITWFIP